ncbi:MAG: amidase [Dehalococcoidia bacterium]
MPVTDLTSASAWELAALIRTKQISPVEIMAHFVDRIQLHNAELNAFVTITAEEAMTAAHRAEQAVIDGDPLGALHGVPIAIKDLAETKGIRTTYGSLLFEDHIPNSDAIHVERIRAAGAIIAGKTNTPEFGWKGTTENLVAGSSRNPWDLRRTPGGSSGGSAAAVSARLVPLADGSDAGGSIRIPASYCGIYGIKPSCGRVASDYTGKGGWRALSQNGPLANTVRDAALLLNVIAGPDGRDALCIPDMPPDFTAAAENPSVEGLRIAWSPRLDGRPVDPEVARLTESAALAFEVLGADVEEATPAVDTEAAVRTWATLTLTDLAVSLGPAIESGRGDVLPPRLLEWVSDAMTWSATRYATALRNLEWHRKAFANFMEDYDLLLLPTMATPPFLIEDPPRSIDGEDVHPSWGFTPFCTHANLTGLPAASVPCGFTSGGLPVGLQIIGRHGEEETVLMASAAFEAAHPWADKRPKRFP